MLFTTHYLDEADVFADRIIVLDHGRVVADGTGAEIKATAGGRTITFTGPDRDFGVLPGVRSVERRGERFALTCSDSDATLRALLADDRVTGVEVSAPRLEDAFLDLVA